MPAKDAVATAALWHGTGYHPGKQMHLSYTLSRAFPTASAECQQQNELEKELEIVCALKDTKLKDITLHKIAETTRPDPT